ncbi:hypothetical protein J5N97_023441 [Dioscorea zingiberensis]|uniref:Exocyst component Exo84 C-terminal domain-containing protein n=1 Tax=Dioscorea zingiberensis TaxID=325984 RepID=A0A9D5C5R4_9LILI|nr:hypothetical protein J5N97_023441 [Dioscorea zingiberensis]
MASRSFRSPFDDLDDEDAGSESEAVSDFSSDEYEDEPQSMTGKGIKRLCSELIELKSASEDDFLKNVYSNYPTFVRVFKDLTVVDSELMNLRQHITSQRRLVQVLENNISLDIESDDSVDSEVEEAGDLDLPSSVARMNNVLEKLDVLLSEHQIDEALVMLKMKGANLRKMQIEDSRLSPYASEISERRARLTEQLTLVADHPRVAPSELQRALSGLCDLGEDERAKFLLLKYYRSRLANRLHDLQSSKQSLHGTYMMELAKVVFSVISQAARSFVLLYGEASPYTSDLIQWAREETEVLSHNLCKFVKSISEMTGGLLVAVETVKTAVSFCTLLNPQRIILQSDLTKLIRPCMEEALQMHVDHLHKVINIFATTDTWVLGKYFISGTSLVNSSIERIDGKMDYCLLSSSGRKFVSLMQAFVDDISPLVAIQMECSILEGLADLFCGYIVALEKAISNQTGVVENDFPKTCTSLELPQQLSIVVTSSAVVQLFPTIASGIFDCIRTSNGLLLKHMGPSLEKELDSWMLSIEEASNQLRGYFCQQFVGAVMSDEEHGWRETLESFVDFQQKPSSPPDLIPSFAFQAFFLRMRNLEKHLKSILVGEDGMLEKLLKELMKAMIIWLSDNLNFWKDTEHGSGQCSCFEQFHLDVDFLVEVARLGGYFSDDLLTAVMDLLAQIEDKFTECESDAKSGAADDDAPDDDWSSDAAKLAIEKLLEVEMLKSEWKEASLVSSGEDFTQKMGDANPFGPEDIGSSEEFLGSVDGESAASDEEDFTKIEIKGRDHSGTVKSNEAEVVEEQNADETLIFPKYEPIEKLDKHIVGAAQSARGELIDLSERLDQALKFDFLDVSNNLDTNVFHGTIENKVLDAPSGIDDKVEQIVKLLLPVPEEKCAGKSDESLSLAINPVQRQSIDSAETQATVSRVQFLEVSDELEDNFVFHATRESTGAVVTDKTDNTEEPDLERLLIFHEEGSVAMPKKASQLVKEKSFGVADTHYLEPKSNMLEVPGENRVTIETDEIAHAEDSGVKGLLIDFEEEVVGNLDESVGKAAEPVVREEPIGAQYLEMMFKLLDFSDDVDAHLSYATMDNTGTVETCETEDPKEADIREFPEESSISELDEFAIGTAQSVRATAIALANMENLVSVNKYVKETDHLDASVFDSNNSAKNLTVLGEDSGALTSKEVKFTPSEVDESAKSIAVNESKDIEKEKVLAGNVKEKLSDESLENQYDDDGDIVETSKTKLNELARPKRKRERPGSLRSVTNVERLGKTKRGSTTPRPRWT